MKVSFSSEADRTVRLIGELPSRVDALVKRALREAADRARARIVEGAPTGDQWAHYRRGLRLVAYDETTYGVVFEGDLPEVERPEPKSALLIVRPRRNKLSPPSVATQILASYNPWTYDSIPFLPDRNEAVVLYRKVGANTATRVTEQRMEDSVTWRRALQGAGVRDTSKRQPVTPTAPKIVQDVVYEVAKLELGLGGAKMAPHWGPAFRDYARDMQTLLSDSWARAVLTKPTFTAWRRSQAVAPVVSSAVRDFGWFQAKVAAKLT